MNDDLKAKLLAVGEEIYADGVAAGKSQASDVQAQIDAAVAAAVAAYKAKLSDALDALKLALLG